MNVQVAREGYRHGLELIGKGTVFVGRFVSGAFFNSTRDLGVIAEEVDKLQAPYPKPESCRKIGGAVTAVAATATGFLVANKLGVNPVGDVLHETYINIRSNSSL